MSTPVLACVTDTSSSGRASPYDGKIVFPPPRTIGSSMSWYSSTRSFSTSWRASEALPQTCRPPSPPLARSERIASIASPSPSPRSVVLFHRERRVLGRQRPRHDVLRDGVHLVGVRIAGPSRPGGGHDVPRPPPEQQRLGAIHDLADDRSHRVWVEERRRPASVLKPIVVVLVLAAGSLHDAVEAHEVADDDAHTGETMQHRRTHRKPSNYVRSTGPFSDDHRHVTEMRGPARFTLGTPCSQLTCVRPPITSRS